MDQQTTSISDESWHPLEVEWNTYHPHVRQPDDTFLEIESHKVTLVSPGMRFLTEEPRRVRLVNLSPRTALNLLAWLEGQKEILEQLAPPLDEEDIHPHYSSNPDCEYCGP